MPTVRAAILLGVAAAAITAIVVVTPDAWAMSLWIEVAAVAIILFDGSRMTRRHDVAARLDGPEVLFVGEPVVAAVGIDSPAGLRAVRLAVDCPDDGVLLVHDREPGDLAAGHHRVELHVMPVKRGIVRIPEIWLGWRSPLGLVATSARFETGAEVPVVPNILAVRRTAVAFDARNNLYGSRPQFLQGDGSEFDALRDYVPGLDHRSIDWKHTARHRKLVCKEFRTERNHQIVVAIDSGRLMAECIDGIAKLDHAVTGAMQLGFVAFREGDRFGLYSFNKDIALAMPPVGGTHSFPLLRRKTAEIAYSSEETNYTLSFTRLAAELNRRSLIVVMTDFEDTVTAELMLDNLARLARRHLVLFVTFAEMALENARSGEVRSLEDVGRAVVADTALRDRQLVLENLRRLGIDCIETTPARFGPDLLNRYIEIKRRDSI
jgi:uncharacterized protein (DUF58 family)